MIKTDQFVEWAIVFGKRYGTAYKSLLAGGSSYDVLLEIDVQGVENLIRYFNKIGKSEQLVTIFIVPPSHDELVNRLLKRGDVTGGELEVRLKTAYGELEKKTMYEYIITNDDLDAAFSKLKSVIIAERCRNRKKIGL